MLDEFFITRSLEHLPVLGRAFDTLQWQVGVDLPKKLNRHTEAGMVHLWQGSG